MIKKFLAQHRFHSRLLLCSPKVTCMYNRHDGFRLCPLRLGFAHVLVSYLTKNLLTAMAVCNSSPSDSVPGNGTANAERLLVQPSDSVSGQLVSVKTVHRRAPTDLVELAQEVNQANRFVRATAHSKLQQIAEQIRFLQEQAKQVLETAVQDGELHNAKCNFKKRPGTVYHLYRKEPGSTFISMLSPEEWPSCPHECLGSYKLEFDMSWTPVEKMEQRARDMALIDKLLVEKTTLPALTSGTS